MPDSKLLEELARQIRYNILNSTTRAGSGHPTSSLSAVELMVALFFARSSQGAAFFRFDPARTEHPNNDRLLFSKGHASPLFYALWAAAGQVEFGELETYRDFDSPLEGHPTRRFLFTEAATGSLGQGLAIGLGMALNGKFLDKLPYRTFVLLGDSEMAEGSQWEAIQVAAHYKLDNLIGILDVNRLGQRGETMYGHDIEAYGARISAFGWRTVLIEDGHDLEQVVRGFENILEPAEKPTMLIARTIKGKGVPFLENKNGWHGKALSEEQFREAVEQLGEIRKKACNCLAQPENREPETPAAVETPWKTYEMGEMIATREAYGESLRSLGGSLEQVVVLDAEVSNSTKAEKFKTEFPNRFFEMFIAEQNMIGAALGLYLRGKMVFASSFAAFLMRACDQIRMARISDGWLKLCGSHAGVSIGQDGPSQMGLEDLAFFRTIPDCVVFYPADGVSTRELVQVAAQYDGMAYLRTTRGKTPVIYDNNESFHAGGCKVLRQSPEDRLTVVAAGITLHETLAAAERLAAEDISIRIIDLYSVKPVDADTLKQAAAETGMIITVEDHYGAGGIGEAVLSAIADSPCPLYQMAVARKPRSGKPEQLLDFVGISRKAVERKIRELLGKNVS